MPYYHIEPGPKEGVSDIADVPIAVSFPERLGRPNFPVGPSHSCCIEWETLAITQWIVELPHHCNLYRSFLNGEEDLVWLAIQNMNDLKYCFEVVSSYDIPDKTKGFFGIGSKPKASYISPALPYAVRVVYQNVNGTSAQRIYCQSPYKSEIYSGLLC